MNERGGSARTAREAHERQRFEAYEAWQREQQPVQLAWEQLDPSGFMWRRAEQLVAERRTAGNYHPGYEPMTATLGGARIAAAHIEAGRDPTAAIQNFHRDIRTALTEALFRGGHISKVDAEINQRGEAVIGDLLHWEMFLRSQQSPPEAMAAEVAEEFYAATLSQSNKRDTHALLVVSPSRHDTAGNTLMIRKVWFEQEDGRWLRRSEQLYVDNSHTGDTNQLLRELGVDHAEDLSEIAILSQPLLIRQDQFPEGVAAFGAMLDAITTERTGQPVFCGTPMPGEVPHERYLNLAEVSRQREQALGEHIEYLVRESLELVRSQVLSFEAEDQRFATMFIKSLRLICADHPEYAEAAFSAKAASHWQAAYDARARGDFETAARETAAAEELSTSTIICDLEVSIAPAAKAEVADDALLHIKYPEYIHKLKIGTCFACKGKDRMLGPCGPGFCNDCDTRDRIQPGYIQDLIDAHPQETLAAETDSALPQLAEIARTRSLRSGDVYEINGESWEFRRRLVVGGMVPEFVRDSQQLLTGEAASKLEMQLAEAA